MRWSRTFIPTLRDDPADAEAVSHKLLLRAGFARQLMAGVYSLLPLGQRVRLKIMGIIRKEMPIHISNVSPVVDGKPTRVGFQKRADGSKARVAVRNGQDLHILRKARG